MTQEISKAYEPQEIERRWAQAWFEEKLYRAEAVPGEKIFSIALPPPNVTGSIHIGHMLEHTQIDILVRWHRMRGYKTLWLPGMDHAGIATQFVVERQLAEQGLTRQQLGREEFERRVWQWKAQSGGKIKEQMIRLGVSCDWTRERFTLEPALYHSVLEAFLRLYREGLIYRGRYIINWCPRCQTAVSDLEVKHDDRPGKLWYIRYPVIGTDRFLTIATTRPETMLGDTAVAVHPEDERYKEFIGKKVLLPLVGREIPVIADSYVDPEFGTGALKITPAHDPNDFEVGKRHHLAEIDVMTDDAHINANGGKYKGFDRYAARAKIVEDLQALGFLDHIEEHMHAVGLCDRCKTEIEPRVSTQWFCKMKSLAERGTQAVNEGLISVVPDNQKKILLDWFQNIRDWCISRQLWWGHRIPIWHCDDCKEMIPALDSRIEIIDGHARAASPPTQCGKCGSSKLTQDKDVLDTWFSSGLWPFSTLGWPEETQDLKTYYPTSLLISGYDILFFWDARIIMMGFHLVNRPAIEQRVPFRNLYLHAIVRDPQGMKMSKTRGNVVDPLEVIEKHGTDALRFALAVMAAPGTDIALSEERILSYRAFANKLWNAARFLFFNLEKIEGTGISIEELASPEVRAKAPYARKDGTLALADAWIFSRLSSVADAVNKALEEYRFHEAAHLVYHFFWGDFCDWYIEWVKPELTSADRDAAIVSWRNIFAVFDAALRLLHPFMPFITEELWHRLPQDPDAKSISLQPFPELTRGWVSPEAEKNVVLLQELIVAARNIRAELKIDQKKRVAADFGSTHPEVRALVETNKDLVLRLAALSGLDLAAGHLEAGNGLMRSTAQFDLRIQHTETVDKKTETDRLQKEKERIENDLASKKARLSDETFRSKAPAHIVEGLEKIIAERQLEYQKLLDRLAQFEDPRVHSAKAED